jgi:hypothetical protein
VTWQGPDLPCLNLCKGDSVSDVVYKVAVEICDLKSSIGLTDVDLTCLVQVCSTTPQPAKTLSNILDLLVSKVCCLSDIVKNLPPPGNNYTEPTFNLSSFCSAITGGGVITSLIHSQLTLRIATVLCSTITTVNAQQATLVNHEGRIYNLEHPTIVIPTYTSCLLGSVQTIPIIVQNLETTFCTYTPVLGTPNSINTAIGKQCANLNNEKLLASGAYITTLGSSWKSSPSSIGDTITNLWAMVCDLRGSVKAILANCCQVDCDSITIDFDYKWVDQYTLRLFFTPKSRLPIGFYDCDDVHGNKITITDGLGNTYDAYFHFRRKDANDHTGILDDTNIMMNGYTLDLTNANAIDVTTGLTFSNNICFTNDTTTCIKCFNKYVTPYINKDCCTITAQDATTIVYKVCPVATVPTTPTTTRTIIP